MVAKFKNKLLTHKEREIGERKGEGRSPEQVHTGLCLKSHLVPTRMNGVFGQ